MVPKGIPNHSVLFHIAYATAFLIFLQENLLRDTIPNKAQVNYKVSNLCISHKAFSCLPALIMLHCPILLFLYNLTDYYGYIIFSTDNFSLFLFPFSIADSFWLLVFKP